VVNINEKDWIEMYCLVCEKPYATNLGVLKQIDSSAYSIHRAGYCGDKCKQIGERTEKNVQNKCSDCGAIMIGYDGANLISLRTS